MKMVSKILGVLMGILFLNCSVAQKIDIHPFSIDLNQFKVDSVINTVNIQDQMYSIILLRDKYNEQLIPFEVGNSGPGVWLPEQAPLTIMIVNKANGDLVYYKKLELSNDGYPSINWQLVKGQERKLAQKGNLLLSLDKSYGGSGSTNFLYLIDRTEKGFILLKLFSSIGELSDFIVANNDQELISISGIWNIKENESHFSEHRYQIKKIAFKGGKIETINLGTTSNKYPCIDEKNTCLSLLSSIIKKESVFAKSIQINKYLP